MIKRARSLICLCVATALSVPNIAIAEADLPEIGTAAGATLTIDQEIIYGDAYMRMIRASSPVVNDPVMNEYVNSIGHRLVSSANDVKTPFTFFMIRDRNINAFAFFGGHVALHTGLFLHAHSESELASVMAHEIAHVTQRHLARRMEDEARRSPATVAALVGSLLLAIAAPQAGMAALTATTAGSMQASINYTRSNEKEADRFGIATLARAKFDVNDMPRFFGRLADDYRYASKPPPMLLTHPLPEDRITDTRARAQNYPPLRVLPSIDYHLARARVVARYANIKQNSALDWFQRTAKKADPAIKDSFEYGKALVYLDNNQLDKSEAILTKLLRSRPNDNFYLDATSDLYIAQGKPEKAVQLMEKALKTKPNNPVITLNYANALLASQQLDKTVQVLQRYTHEHPDDTNGWHLLSEANIKLSNSDGDLAARAEIMALNAQWDKSIQLYSQASQLATLGSLKQARYDARIDQLLVQRDRFMALQ
ncbi:hypothetical protein BCU70_22365 [Vibrio sp. 10N.286.49.C2]|uniref:beta-barrel assembly-enhancing protease n=1 Tax=unclassified Vibrio TaxID=2614977 RepID=UPI000C82C9E7|nr:MULTISPECIES: M48 family metallopeptidase [unclassified Vibrio]PMH26297.1 hypothetical protein BCU70_22365 [Vibrio sp. 10N.286.49.C2]PMH53466.1 hypothetical protein BCU66_01190 [Vibrio sp. 10N.286.49.B1]PMH80656.1 hypothetical protein BCU58_23100 [Vibrio sp. 10N.286.48.B7]